MSGSIFRFCFFSTALTPIVLFSHLAYPAVTAKTLYFVGLVDLMFIAWAFFYFKKDRLIKVTPINIVLVGLILVLFLTTLVGVDPVTGLWSDFERMEGFYLWFHLLMFFVLLGLTVTKDDWYTWLKIVFIVGGAIAFFGIAQHISLGGNGGRINTIFNNPMFLGQYLLMSFFLGLAVCLRERKSTYITLYGILAAAHVPAFLLTGTRGVALGFLTGLLFIGIAFAFCKGIDAKVKRLALGTVGVCVILLGFLVTTDLSDTLFENNALERYANISIADIKTYPRYYSWKAGIEGIAERPLLGWGIEQYGVVSEKYTDPVVYNPSVIRNLELWSDRPHNIFIGYGIYGGIPLLTLFVALLAFAYYGLFARTTLEKSERIVLGALLAAYAASGFFGIDTISTLIILFGVLGFIHASWEDMDACTYRFPMYSKRTAFFIKSSAVVVGMFALVIFLVRLQSASLLAYVQKTTEPFSPARFEALSAYLETVRIPGDRTFARNKLVVTGNGILFSDNMLNDEAYERITRRVQVAYEDESEKRTISAKELFFYGSFMRLVGKKALAVTILEKAIGRAPERIHILLELGRAYVEAGNVTKADEVIRRAYALEPTYAPSQRLYGALLIREGAVEEGRQVLKEGFGSSLIYDRDILSAYLSAGEYEDVVFILTEKLKTEPVSVYARSLLIYTYYIMDKTEKMQDILEETHTLLPEQRMHFDTLLAEIEEGSFRAEALRVFP